MKRIYLLLALFIAHYAASAQTIIVNDAGVVGSYKSGYTQASTGRTDGNMVIATGAIPRRGYAVFNLSRLPGGATVMTASLRFNFRTADTATAIGDSCSIFGYAGDLSTVTLSPALYADCASGAAFNTANWGVDTASAGSQNLLSFLDTGLTFLQTNHGSIVSIGFATFSGVNVYTVTGEGGTAATQPQLAITYSCTGVYSVTASASPNPVCAGNIISLNGAGTGLTYYSWSGPGGFTSTLENATLVASASAAGVYTFTGTNVGGCPTMATTASIAVNSVAPTAIHGVLHECVDGAVILSDGASGGVWSSSIPPVATITSIGSASGLMIGYSAGTTVITYNTGCGGYVTAIDTVYAVPVIFAGVGDSVCIGATTAFAYLPAGGTWSSSNTAIATVLPGSGLIAGISAGTATIIYTIAHGCSATQVTKVNPPPPAIMGITYTCPGSSVTLSDPTPGGTWSSDQSYIASASGTTGKVTGVSAGLATIIYTDGSQCSITTIVTVNPLPLPIIGGVTSCGGTVDTLYDATSDGVWSSGNISTAAITAVLFDTSAAVTALNGGTATISYTLATGCAVTKSFTVDGLPVPTVTYNWITTTFYTDTFYTSYQWYNTVQNLIMGATADQTAAQYTGNYWVVVTDTNGCAGSSAHEPYSTSWESVATQTKTAVSVYPNPANDVVYIQSGMSVRAVISDMDGKTALEVNDAKEVNISKLANGVYFISLYGDDGHRVMVEKLVKE